MNTNLSFCYDRLQVDGTGYANLAKSGLKWQEWDFHWPKTIKIRLLKFFKNNNYSYKEVSIDDAKSGSWYPIGISWFDFDCDYLGLIPAKTLNKIKNGDIKILFYYHEGDNPYRIKERLEFLCKKYTMPESCYLFISANTAANNIENFVYFNDHESFFASINRRQFSTVALNKKRVYDFTALSRAHKWWRATCILNLKKHNILTNSIWSYHSDCDIGDSFEDNPIDLSEIKIKQNDLKNFVNSGPYVYDKNFETHNDHRFVNLEPLHQSYFNLVIETHFDADQSKGVFLTEKTFKPIKFGQPFIIIGTANSLKLLRSLGYRTFDSVIDNSYDSIENNTERWKAIRNTIQNVKKESPEKLFEKCYNDIIHNQYHFTHRIKENLNYIIKEINYRR